MSLERAAGGAVLGYIRELSVRRVALLGRWRQALAGGLAPKLFSGEFAVRIRELLRPATLLDSLRQQTARATGGDIAALELASVFASDPAAQAQR